LNKSRCHKSTISGELLYKQQSFLELDEDYTRITSCDLPIPLSLRIEGILYFSIYAIYTRTWQSIDNLGEKQLEAALDNMKTFRRIVLCGMISQYNATFPTPGPSNIFLAITKRLRLQGFIVRDHYDMVNQFLADMSKWIKEGKIKWKETIFEGLENSP
jgi:hypothetical protein